MTTLAYTVPTAGVDANSVADPEVATALNTIKTWANGNIDAVNLSALLAQSVGANQNGQAVKGVTNIVASESRTNVAYGTLPTPDQVQNVVLPANGLIAVLYHATWSETVQGASRAAIFIGVNQYQAQVNNLNSVFGPALIAARNGGTATDNTILTTAGTAGVASVGATTSIGADVTTGQGVGMLNAANQGNLEVAGGSITLDSVPYGAPTYIQAAAGTYTISVQFKASSGSVTALNRKLWVQALSFA